MLTHCDVMACTLICLTTVDFSYKFKTIIIFMFNKILFLYSFFYKIFVMTDYLIFIFHKRLSLHTL